MTAYRERRESEVRDASIRRRNPRGPFLRIEHTTSCSDAGTLEIAPYPIRERDFWRPQAASRTLFRSASLINGRCSGREVCRIASSRPLNPKPVGMFAASEDKRFGRQREADAPKPFRITAAFEVTRLKPLPCVTCEEAEDAFAGQRYRCQ